MAYSKSVIAHCGGFPMVAHISTEMINYSELLMFNFKFRGWVRKLFLKISSNCQHEERHVYKQLELLLHSYL